MNILEITPRPLDHKQFIKRGALPADAPLLITADTLVTCQGRPVLLYKLIGADADTRALRRAVRAIKYKKEKRTQGLLTESAIFGYNPRNTIRKDYCSATLMAYNQPQQHAAVTGFGPYLSALYAEYFPEIYARHHALVQEKILPAWQIKETPFTSGIVNRNNPLKYHFDSGNFEDVLSNMVVIKAGTTGGQLVCPELGIILECADNSVVLFDGQKILHGVTPISKDVPDAYRYSVVYYTLRQMWKCEPLNDELARIRRVHTLRERARGEKTIEDLNTDKPLPR